MTATVKVKFPDGVRNVSAYFERPDYDDPRSLGGLKPIAQDGWEFHEVIGGGEVRFHAAQVPERGYMPDPTYFYYGG